MTTVADIVDVLETAYPPALAEDWDSVGLICGDPADEVTRTAFALEATDAVVDEALAAEVEMLVVHHPLLMRGVDTVAADTAKGRIIHRLIRGGCALFAAHTNADSARPGVNDRLAELVGIVPGRPIKPKYLDAYDHWGVHVLGKDAEKLKRALFDAGAGTIGNYHDCAYEITGVGQFTPHEGAEPTEGTVGLAHRSTELRVEFVASRRLRHRLLTVLREEHPYEEPAFDIVEMADDTDLDKAYGLGRIGELPEPMTLRDFTQQVADRLPETTWGVRAAGDPDAIIRTVAVSSGAGDSMLATVARMDVDVLVTSDLRHHPVDEHIRAGGCAVIDTAHWASEYPWTSQVAEIVSRDAGTETLIIPTRTDPWTVSAHRTPSRTR
ncbi:Nif3-like dinuclear metal center hexameric protein [Corynebacterium guangdongense]|uniref:GTP cyclohydrolase 1 type 2 homolog n=1 Tax=Corynebacterium guangdongense TaxID=1783348 RepID=A0ABU1ZY21_9CORY|nr:Nif3-like dinuclear metal center hexameric protein [Corynebacterium guangdongense]MDR7329820.1 dinuclear metal center YbgI/SA1388 family protein [Corynebacterium guangdongense]WJZ18383.1 Putative GTP cyclohydrolase 1 type 2 [Corynebacterium guangdongense]